MYKKLLFLLLLTFVHTLKARTLEVGAGKQFGRLQEAAVEAKPGDIILMRGGIYGGNDFISDLKGTKDNWINIRAAKNEKVIFRGGKFAFQMSNPAFLKIEGLVFEGQTGNSVNIDDGGTYLATAHHIVIENCEWRNMAASGNNDELKISGLENFIIRNCRFFNGSRGGSLIDMVGCHNGLIEGNIFVNGGANAIQAKGGTKNIAIQRNRFTNGGERTINIGGSTGLSYFRPQGAKFEAASIYVYVNIFTGSDAPIAFVGAINCEVINNTFIKPERWAIRILQENTNPGFMASGKNSILNNIFVLAGSASPVNIGPGTAPETFVFSNNLWFIPNQLNKTDLQLPVRESNQIVNQDPQFSDTSFHLKATSPAIGKGQAVTLPDKDFYGKPFKKDRAIGAVEKGEKRK